MKKIKITSLCAVVYLGVISGAAFADRCSPEMLDKLPPKKRAVIAKNCEKRAIQKAYKISNANQIDKEKRPQDNYSGGDKGDLEKMIRSAWSKKYPNDQIMGIHFEAKDWKRTQNKRWNEAIKGWYYTDVSVLVAKVVVKTDNKVATIFPAYINKDNKDGSLNTGVATKTSEYVVKQILISNY